MTKTGQITTYGLYFCLFMAIQILIFLHFSLFQGTALCFVYIAFLLILPYDISNISLILIGFFSGLFVDMFYNTGGIHAAATVLIAFLRPYIINTLTPRGGYEEGVELSVASLGFRWFATYAIILIFIHHFMLFIIWLLGFGDVLLVLSKTIASSVFTLVIVLLFQYLIFSPKKV